MRNVKQVRFWKRKHGLTAGEATLLGLVIGCAVAVVAAFNPPRDFSFSFMWGLLVSIGALSAFAGYIFWLLCQPVLEERFRRISTVLAIPVLVVLFVAFPGFWREVGRSMGPHMVLMFIAFAFATTMFAVAVGFGIVHLVAHVMRSLRPSANWAPATMTNGVWDREFD